MYALVIAGVLAVGTGRQVAVGSGAIADCEAARARGDQPEAVAAARRAAEAVLPGTPYAAKGYEHLSEIAQDAERRGDEATAGSAWRGMRSAALGTRGFGVDTGKWRNLAEEGLIRVAAQMAHSAPARASMANAPAAEKALRATLGSDDTPSPWRFAALAVAAAVLVAAVARALRALTRIQIVRAPSHKAEENRE